MFSGTDAAHYKSWNVGKTKRLDGFISSSVRLKDAVGFATHEESMGNNSLIMEIQVPKSTPCLFVGENTSYPWYQGELILKNGLKYLVKERTNEKMLLEVVLDE